MAGIRRPAKKEYVEVALPARIAGGEQQKLPGRATLEFDAFLGLLTDAVNAVSQGGLVATKIYTVATVPSAVDAGAGRVIYVSNGAAGLPILAFSDGTNWLRVDDRNVIS